ncbi:MAG TPA: ABC transporter permease, partial [Phototrophicaceae bacterium]|nr:ABC transporter permease [Phototrophicaceae bacterium]
LIKIGGLDQTKESVRNRRGLPWLDSLFQDTRFALRMLRKNPGFTAVAVLTLALGIGANTAIFSLVNAVLLNSLPVANPHELVLFSDHTGTGTSSGGQTGIWDRFSSYDYDYFVAHNESFKELTAYQDDRTSLYVRIADAQKTEVARTTMVAGNYFSFLGIHAAAGRLISPEDDDVSSAPVTVLNYAYWTSRFHNDPAVLGKTIEINGTPFTIIGVTPPGFAGMTTFAEPNFWTPLAKQPVITLPETNGNLVVTNYASDPHVYWLSIVGRLKRGVSLRKAETIVNAQLQQELKSQPNPEGADLIADSRIQLHPGAGGLSFTRMEYGQIIETLAVVMGIVLLIACANVASLLLSRSAGREKEVSVRLAVGASRSRLIRQMLTESVILAGIGGAVGILAAQWITKLLVLFVTGNFGALGSRVDASILAFSICITLLTGLLFGLAPALSAGRTSLANQIKGLSNSHLRLAFPNLIVIFQVAGSLILLVGAGLFVRTLQNLANQKLGFDQGHLVLVSINVQSAGYKPEQTPQLYQRLIKRFEAIPGVRFATLDSDGPFSNSVSTSNFAIEGRHGRQDDLLKKELVGPHYFESEGIPILLGRDIEPDDRAGIPLVAVINETMAREYFPGVNPVGKRFSLGWPFDPKEAMTIVGVAADARYYSLRDAVPPMEFGAAFQVPDPKTWNWAFARDVAIRTSGDPASVEASIRPAVKSVDAAIPVTSVRPMKQVVSDTLRQNRAVAELSSGFGMLTLLLACIGLYGTLAYRVSRRTQEIGVRMALGAQRSNVMWLVTREGLYLIVPGIAVGIVAALASTKIVASQLFGVSANDPLTFAATAALLLVVALVACWIPARRAMRVDPMVALRHE